MDEEEIEITAQELTTETPVTEGVFSDVDIDTCAVHVVNGEPEVVGDKKLTIGVFFDGTNNNRENVKSSNPIAGSDSYEASLSNIARAEMLYIEDCSNENDKITKIYIEGAGSTNNQKDSMWGYAMGSGGTGIVPNIIEACRLIKNKIGSNEVIDLLTIDLFGFSRGAATCRTFAHEMMKKKGITYDDIVAQETSHLKVNISDYGILGVFLRDRDVSSVVKRINIRFAGLYDTVSSYQTLLDGLPPHSFDDNTEDLQLHAIDVAEVIVHLTAMDEHRDNFSLTKIKGNKSKHFEYSLPGVHSDIGGGYVDGEPERQVISSVGMLVSPDLLRVDADMNRYINEDVDELVHQGWFDRETEIEIIPNQIYSLNGQVRTHREKISNRYSWVVLQIMTELCHRHVGKALFYYEELLKQFDISPINNDNNNNIDLRKVKVRLKDYIEERKPLLQIPSLPNSIANEDIILLRKLRNKHLHFSSRTGEIGHHARLIKEGNKIVRKRRIYSN